MRKILGLGASLALFSVMAFAESWSGTLVDATCAMQNQQSQSDQGGMGSSSSVPACEPTSTTTAFALRTSSGQTYQLDDAGNAKVITAMKDRADRMKDEGSSASSSGSTPVHATVKGTLNNSIIKVESVQVQ